MKKFHTGGKAKGFTLIEMSIVLVIIGLIIGGILKGQEIIESSRQKATITQIDGVRSAVNSFVDLYNGVPGDYLRATNRIQALSTGTNVNGTGDGRIGPAAVAAAATFSTASNAIATHLENLNFFNHLAGAGLMGGVSVQTTVADQTFFGEGSLLPTAPIAGSGMSIINGTGFDGRVSHWMRLHATVAGPTVIISPKRSYEMDLKSDDGTPSAGDMQAATAAGAQTANTCNGATAAVYNVLGQTANCILMFNMLP